MEWIVITLGVLIIILIYILFNLLRKVERLDDELSDVSLTLVDALTSIEKTYSDMKLIDSKQIFERKYYSTKEGYNGAQGTNGWIFIARENGRVCKLLEPESFESYDGVSIKYDPASDFPNGFQFVVLKHRIDKLINELNSQAKLNDKVSSSSNAHPRTEASYQRLVAALLSVIDGTIPKRDYVNDSQLIQQLAKCYQGYDGLSKSTLERRLPECRNILK